MKRSREPGGSRFGALTCNSNERQPRRQKRKTPKHKRQRTNNERIENINSVEILKNLSFFLFRQKTNTAAAIWFFSSSFKFPPIFFYRCLWRPTSQSSRCKSVCFFPSQLCPACFWWTSQEAASPCRSSPSCWSSRTSSSTSASPLMSTRASVASRVLSRWPVTPASS